MLGCRLAPLAQGAGLGDLYAMNLSRVATTAVAALFLGGALPSVAAATDYCVTPNIDCAQNNVGTFQDALNQAASNNDADRILLGADTYVPPPGQDGFIYSSWDAPVEIVGSGRGQTILTGKEFASGRVLNLFGGPGSSVHDLTIQIPRNVAANFTGLLTMNTAQRVDVTEDTVQANPHDGAMLLQGGVLEDSNVTLESPQKTIGVLLGVPIQGTPPTLRRSSVQAATGVRVDGGATIERARVIGTNAGVVATGNDTTIRDSFLTITGNFGTVLRANTQANDDTNVTADGLTIFASNLPDIGGVTVSTGPSPSHNAHLTLTNSIVRGGFTPLSAVAGGAGTGTISASYSDYDPSGNIEFGGSADISESNISNVGYALGFSEETGREFALLPGSPLIDAGDPAAPQGVDMHGDPRVADGNGDGVARRDLGAFELQPAPPAGQQPPGGAPTADTQAPLISGFRSSHSVFAITRAGTPLAARVARGTWLRYRLSENARVVLKIQRALAGRHTRYRGVGTLRRSGVSGLNRTRFTGRIGRRALQPGRYRVVITATDAAGNRSARKTTSFRITRG
jgi:hypothetical protein